MKAYLKRLGIYPHETAIYFDAYEMVFDRMEELQVRKISPETVEKVERAFPETRLEAPVDTGPVEVRITQDPDVDERRRAFLEDEEDGGWD